MERDFRGRGFGGPRRGGFRGGFRSNFKREMHKVTCSECGKEAEVPFKPKEGLPVYCKECFLKKKGISTKQDKPESEEESDEEDSDEDSEE